MKVTDVAQEPKGWLRFDLSVGGFVVKGCRWRPETGQVLFPRRYDKHGCAHPVVFAHGKLVKRLRALLESRLTQLLRDRKPCVLRPRFRGYSRNERHPWIVFDFTVRGFKILGCRWLPENGSIQLPVTFIFDEHRPDYRKKAVVCAFGAPINRLRDALEAGFQAEPAEAVLAK